MDERKIKSFDEELIVVEDVHDEVDAVKKKLTKRLEQVVDDMDLSPEALTGKSAAEGKMAFIKGLLDVVESREKSQERRAALKARSKELDSNEKFAENVAMGILKLTPIGRSDTSVPSIDPNSTDLPDIGTTEEERKSISEASLRTSNEDLSD